MADFDPASITRMSFCASADLQAITVSSLVPLEATEFFNSGGVIKLRFMYPSTSDDPRPFK